MGEVENPHPFSLRENDLPARGGERVGLLPLQRRAWADDVVGPDDGVVGFAQLAGEGGAVGGFGLGVAAVAEAIAVAGLGAPFSRGGTFGGALRAPHQRAGPEDNPLG
jgi:hypothetical protein